MRIDEEIYKNRDRENDTREREREKKKPVGVDQICSGSNN